MIEIMLVLFGGMAVGVLLRGRNMGWLPRVIVVIIYLLLLLLGVSVGSNPDITENLSTLGIQALVITLLAVLGSITAAALIYRYFFKGRSE